jgi:hypothetical protein
MRLRKRGIKLELFLEMLGDNFRSRESFLTGLPQPRTSGDLEILSKWYFGKSLKAEFTGGFFGPFKYRNGDSIISKSSAKRMMKEEMEAGKGIGHVVINMDHQVIEEDSEFNEAVKKAIEKRIGLDSKKYCLNIDCNVAKRAFFGSIFSAKQGGGFSDSHAYNSTYYFEDIKKGEILEDWVRKSNQYQNILKYKKRQKSITGKPWDKWNFNCNDELRLQHAKDELYKTSPEFMKEFNRLKNLNALV